MERQGQGLGTVYIENMGGAGGVIGASSVARAPADGYTLLLGTTSELVISPLLGKLPYDPVTSFEPIAIMCDSPAAIVVHPSVPVSNLKELVAYAKQHKNGLSYGSAGASTVSRSRGRAVQSDCRSARHRARALQGRRAGRRRTRSRARFRFLRR